MTRRKEVQAPEQVPWREFATLSFTTKERTESISQCVQTAFLKVGDVQIDVREGKVEIKQGPETYPRSIYSYHPTVNPNHTKMTLKIGAGAPPPIE